MGENYVVVIVTHNRLELLKECLMHVEEQTVAAMEIIVVDNASNDGTAQFLREKSMHGRYRILTCTENVGGAGGFERGVRLVLECEKTWDTAGQAGQQGRYVLSYRVSQLAVWHGADGRV